METDPITPTPNGNASSESEPKDIINDADDSAPKTAEPTPATETSPAPVEEVVVEKKKIKVKKQQLKPISLPVDYMTFALPRDQLNLLIEAEVSIRK